MDWIAKGGVDFIEDCATNHPGTPFFLYFSTTLTHAPYTPEKAWGSDPTATWRGYEAFDTPLLETDGTTWTRDTIETRLAAEGLPVENHLACLLWLDDSLGALMATLEKHVLDDNTLIIIFDDHGHEYGGKGGLYEHGANSVAIAWRKNGFPCGTNSAALLANTDFAPTILDYAGVEVPFAHFDGKSFRPILEGYADEIRNSCYLEFGCGRGVIMDNWKYISVRWPDPSYNPLFSDPSGNLLGWASLKVVLSGMEANVRAQHPNYYSLDQLYDLTTDPGEQANLADDPAHAERLQLMKNELQTYIDSNPGPYAEFKSSTEALHKGLMIELL